MIIIIIIINVIITINNNNNINIIIIIIIIVEGTRKRTKETSVFSETLRQILGREEDDWKGGICAVV